MANERVKDGEGFPVYHRYACARVTGITGGRFTILHPLREPIDQAAWVRRSSGQLVGAYGRFRPLDRRVRDLAGGQIWFVAGQLDVSDVAGQLDVSDIARHRCGSRTDRVQPPALPLNPLSRERFKLPQRSFSRAHALCRNVVLTLGHVTRSLGGAGSEPDMQSLTYSYLLLADSPEMPGSQCQPTTGALGELQVAMAQTAAAAAEAARTGAANVVSIVPRPVA